MTAAGRDDGIEISSRYDVLPYNGCDGLCEGTGWIPVKSDVDDPILRHLWETSEAIEPSDDGWHFVQCPQCGGAKGLTDE